MSVKKNNKQFFLFILIFILFFSISLHADRQPSYKKTLKRWTRSGRVYVVENFEARLIWSATYLSPEMRTSLRNEKSSRYFWTPEEIRKEEEKDREEASRYDVFLVGIYAGSSNFPEVGRNEGQWRFRSNQREAVSIERIPITQVEREVFKYLDKWSEFYRVKFPKKYLSVNDKLYLMLGGLPSTAQLEWKIKE